MNSLLLSLGCLWLRTLRIHWVKPKELPTQAIFVLWHEHLPACIPIFSHLGIEVLISKSADGAWAAEACRRFGYKVHRGSSSHGGQAGIRTLARSLTKPGLLNGLAGMALDGPKGPYRQAQPGSNWLAQWTGIPVVPVFIVPKTAFRLSTWDRCLIPLPFSKVKVHLGIPFTPLNSEEINLAMQALEHSISSQVIYIATPQSA